MTLSDSGCVGFAKAGNWQIQLLLQELEATIMVEADESQVLISVGVACRNKDHEARTREQEPFGCPRIHGSLRQPCYKSCT